MAIRGRTDNTWLGTALNARDPLALARFYSALLGWPLNQPAGDPDPTWITMKIPGGHTNLAFMLDEQHEPPVWPSERATQSMQMHLDIGVTDVSAALEDAVALGATVAEYQPQDDVRVLIDPEGHPFCLYLDLREDD